MKEAKITCNIAQIKIPDQGLTLVQGQTIWRTEEKYERSEDLKHASSIGALSVKWKERARVTKPPPPPNFRRLVPGQHRKPSPEPKRDVKPATAIVEQVDTEALAKIVKAAVTGELSQQKDALAGQFTALQEALMSQISKALESKGNGGIDAETLQQTLTATLTAAMANMPQQQVVVQQQSDSSSGAPAPKRKDEGPMFIPKGIVTEAKGNIRVQEGSTESTGLDDAAAALKALKKKRKRNKDG